MTAITVQPDNRPLVTTTGYLADLRVALSKHLPIQGGHHWITSLETLFVLGKEDPDVLAFAQELRRCFSGIVNTMKMDNRMGIPSHSVELNIIYAANNVESGLSALEGGNLYKAKFYLEIAQSYARNHPDVLALAQLIAEKTAAAMAIMEPMKVPALVAALENPPRDGYISVVDLPALVPAEPELQVNPPRRPEDDFTRVVPVAPVDTAPVDGPAEATREALTTQEQHAIVFSVAAQVTGTLHPVVNEPIQEAAVPPADPARDSSTWKVDPDVIGPWFTEAIQGTDLLTDEEKRKLLAHLESPSTQGPEKEPKPADAPPATAAEETGSYHDGDYVPHEEPGTTLYM